MALIELRVLFESYDRDVACCLQEWLLLLDEACSLGLCFRARFLDSQIFEIFHWQDVPCDRRVCKCLRSQRQRLYMNGCVACFGGSGMACLCTRVYCCVVLFVVTCCLLSRTGPDLRCARDQA